MNFDPLGTSFTKFGTSFIKFGISFTKFGTSLKIFGTSNPKLPGSLSYYPWSVYFFRDLWKAIGGHSLLRNELWNLRYILQKI